MSNIYSMTAFFYHTALIRNVTRVVDWIVANSLCLWYSEECCALILIFSAIPDKDTNDTQTFSLLC